MNSGGRIFDSSLLLCSTKYIKTSYLKVFTNYNFCQCTKPHNQGKPGLLNIIKAINKLMIFSRVLSSDEFSNENTP